MLLIGIFFVFIVLMIYVSFKILITSGSFRVSFVSFVAFVYITVHILMLCGVGLFGHLVKNKVCITVIYKIFLIPTFVFSSLIFLKIKAAKTGRILHIILSFEDDTIVKEKLSILLHQLASRAPDFNCGLFSFDLKLVFSVPRILPLLLKRIYVALFYR